MQIEFKPWVKTTATAIAGIALGAGAVGAFIVEEQPWESMPTVIEQRDVSVIPAVAPMPSDDALFDLLEARCMNDYASESPDEWDDETYMDCVSFMLTATCQFEPLEESHEFYGPADRRCTPTE